MTVRWKHKGALLVAADAARRLVVGAYIAGVIIGALIVWLVMR